MESVFDLAGARAPVAITQVAIVAGFVRARQNHRIAAHGLADATAAVGLVLAIGAAAIEGRDVAIVALFGSLANAVAAGGRLTCLPGYLALEALLELAVLRAPGRARIAVVALLETGHDPIAALGPDPLPARRCTE